MEQLQTPLSFAQLLETWIMMPCSKCGRGGTQPLVRVKDSTKLEFARLFDTWMGTFCLSCGRGLQQTQQESVFFPSDFALLVNNSSLMVFYLLKQWIESRCESCHRGTTYEIATAEMILAPISFTQLTSAWTGAYCRICGLGGHELQDSSLSFSSSSTTSRSHYKPSHHQQQHTSRAPKRSRDVVIMPLQPPPPQTTALRDYLTSSNTSSCEVSDPTTPITMTSPTTSSTETKSLIEVYLSSHRGARALYNLNK